MLRGELGSHSGRRDLVCLLDESGPDLRLCFLAQLIVLDAQVDATLDRLVEDGHSVRGQYHHALEVLQLPQEDGDEGVVLQVVLGAGFEEDVGLVQQEDGLPAGDEVENLRETVFELFRVETEIAGTDLLGVSERRDVVALVGGDKLERAVVSDTPKPLLPSMSFPLPVDHCNSKQLCERRF